MIFNVTGFIEDTVEGLTVMINSCICLWISIYFSPPKPSGLAFENMIFITCREVWIRIRHMRFYVGCTIIWSNRASRGLVLSGNKKIPIINIIYARNTLYLPNGSIFSWFTYVVYIAHICSTNFAFFDFLLKKTMKQTNNKKVVGTRVTFKLYEPFVLILHFPNWT